jgi:hypothetical protein
VRTGAAAVLDEESESDEPDANTGHDEGLQPREDEAYDETADRPGYDGSEGVEGADPCCALDAFSHSDDQDRVDVVA